MPMPIHEDNLVETAENALSGRDHWSSKWGEMELGKLEFDFRSPEFRDIDTLLKRHLPSDDTFRFLEVGCCPGEYLWYFHERFGYQPTGLEYLEEGCVETRNRFSKQNLEAEIIHGDLFEYAPDEDQELWDVVASFGLVEHFEDIQPCLERHIDLVKPGGYLVLSIPNHSGLNGSILKAIDRDVYDIHNHMNLSDLLEGLKKTRRVEILKAGYLGRIGFWNTDIYTLAARRSRAFYLAVRAPLKCIELMGRFIPNSGYFSPNITVVARRHSCDAGFTVPDAL